MDRQRLLAQHPHPARMSLNEHERAVCRVSKYPYRYPRSVTPSGAFTHLYGPAQLAVEAPAGALLSGAFEAQDARTRSTHESSIASPRVEPGAREPLRRGGAACIVAGRSVAARGAELIGAETQSTPPPPRKRVRPSRSRGPLHTTCPKFSDRFSPGEHAVPFRCHPRYQGRIHGLAGFFLQSVFFRQEREVSNGSL